MKLMFDAHTEPCHKPCRSHFVNTIAKAQKLKGCTKINGSLIIRYNAFFSCSMEKDLLISNDINNCCKSKGKQTVFNEVDP